MRLTDHFSLAEMTVSEVAARKGLDNTPPGDVIEALLRTAQGLERIRTVIMQPIIVLSGYRAPAVNEAVGGSKTSQHLRGEAADIIAPAYGSPALLAEFLERRMDEFGIDQLILEYGRWVHVSFAAQPRRMALTIDAAGTKPGIIG